MCIFRAVGVFYLYWKGRLAMDKQLTLGGLSRQEAERRLQQNGLNEVSETKFNFWKVILIRLWEPSAWILEAALVIEIILGKEIQAGFIVLMLLFAAVNGAIQSGRSSKVLHQLAHELTPQVSVCRSKQWQKMDAKKLVVGDLINLRSSEIVPADVKLVSADLELDESSITGESNSVKRQKGEQAFAGTEVVSGDALAIVTATGINSRSGKTISLVNQNSAPGHLQQLLGKIIGYLAILDAILAVIMIIVAVVRHENLIEMLPFLAMLFIATIPIAMPSSFAVANSVEANVLSKEDVLVSDLSGIQEAANMDALLVDKTGTITVNRPQVTAFYNLSELTDDEVIRNAVSAADIVNPSVIDQAIINYAADKDDRSLTVQQFQPFDATIGYSVAIVGPDRQSIYLGALKRLMVIDDGQTPIPATVDYNAGRTVAVMRNNRLLGIFVLQDQPRADSTASIQALQERGVKVVMLTGDNRKTAQIIANQVGLNGTVLPFADLNNDTAIDKLAGIAEVVPENKLAMVKQFQRRGYIVGMTGDGVNDAPALKQAEVGIAVANAVDLAKRSAKLVLMTDGLSSIVKILDSGHRVYQRMMTWTITKLSRTAELTMLLTFGYLVFHFMPLTLNAMILVAILNDLVTLVLGTDNTHIRLQPEKWNLSNLSRVAGVFAAGWTIVGTVFATTLVKMGYSADQVSTGLYVYLIFSAMLTILMTRTTRPFWRSKPSLAVIIAITLNCLLTLLLAALGWGIAQISGVLIVATVVLTIIIAVALTLIWKLINLSR